MSDFFDYYCDGCDAPLCERVQIMNLALDNVEMLYCMSCLAKEQDMSQGEVAHFVKGYVESRECFKTPWEQFAEKARQCPRIETQTCFCQDEAR